MISAAVLARQWSVKRARKLQSKFRRSSSNTSKRYNKAGLGKITSIESEYVAEKNMTIHMHLFEKDETDSNLFTKSPAVLYKNDEDRFSHEITLKLKTFSRYNVIFEVDDKDHQLMYVSLGGKVYNCFKMIEKTDVRVYGFVWRTDRIQVTQRKHRSILPCLFEFKGYNELSIDLSAKFYDKDEESRYTGTALSAIHMSSSFGKKTFLKNISFD